MRLRQNMMVEINPSRSIENLNRQGVLAKDDHGHRLLLHQGRPRPRGIRVTEEKFDAVTTARPRQGPLRDGTVTYCERCRYRQPAEQVQNSIAAFVDPRKDRIRPLGLVDALAIARAEPQSVLPVNTRSSRAAIQLPTASLMLDDGAIEHRVRLLRTTDELRFGLDALAETHWQPADRKLFCELWQAEVAAVPEFTTSTFHIVTGLLLPIWRRLPDHNCQVYRIQTDDGERIIGRHIAPTLVATMLRTLGVDNVPTLAPAEAWTGLVDGRNGLQLADGLILRRSRVMNDYRVELIGVTHAMVPRLKALGLISEIISWKLRLFIPTGGQGCAMLAALLERHALVGVTDRTAAA